MMNTYCTYKNDGAKADKGYDGSLDGQSMCIS